jgi:hypothetical protein
MRVQVTQEDIEQGEQGSCKHCPIAIAVSRATGKKAYVGYDGISTGELPGPMFEPRWQYETPKVARDFIVDFDYGLPTHPFEFELVPRGQQEKD